MASDDETARRLLHDYRIWAVVGCSDDPWRASHHVSRFLLDRGYDVIPVNPQVPSVHGLPCHPSLRDIGRAVEVVDIFRRSDQVGPHVDEAIEIGARAIWMQMGVIDEEAAARARAAGLDVVMNRCPERDWPIFFGRPA